MGEQATDGDSWDLVVVGAGPAGASAALGALTADPGLRVLLLDRADFPRDKSCGDGIAPHVLDALRSGRRAATSSTAGRRCGGCELSRGGSRVAAAAWPRPVWVIPAPGLRRPARRARRPAPGRDLRAAPGPPRPRPATTASCVDGTSAAGSWSARTAPTPWCAPRPVSRPARRRALAIRGYAPTPPARRGPPGDRVRRPPAAVVRLGLRPRRRPVQRRVRRAARRPATTPPSRALLLDQLERLAARAPSRPAPRGAATTCRCRLALATSPTGRCCWPATPPGWSTR